MVVVVVAALKEGEVTVKGMSCLFRAASEGLVNGIGFWKEYSVIR